MGTRSNVYVETEPGTYLGTYCHYDGYPSNMFPVLSEIDSETLLTHILIAAPQGGFRVLGIEGTEYLGDYSYPCVLQNPSMVDMGPEYVYIKRLDGRVQWRDTYEDYAPDDEEVEGWRFTYCE